MKLATFISTKYIIFWIKVFINMLFLLYVLEDNLNFCIF